MQVAPLNCETCFIFVEFNVLIITVYFYSFVAGVVINVAMICLVVVLLCETA